MINKLIKIELNLKLKLNETKGFGISWLALSNHAILFNKN